MLGRVLRVLGYFVKGLIATDDGTGTGQIDDRGMVRFCTVDCDSDANHIVTLPQPVIGKVVILAIGTTGCEVRSSAPATVAINGGTGAAVESAIGASTLAIFICESLTSWKAFQIGSDGTLAQVEAAA